MNDQMIEIFENIKSCYSNTEQGAWKDGFGQGYQAAIALLESQAQQESKPLNLFADKERLEDLQDGESVWIRLYVDKESVRNPVIVNLLPAI